MKWRSYDGRYGKCIGIHNRTEGLAFQMEDGSEHFIGSWSERVLIGVRILFTIYVFLRGSF